MILAASWLTFAAVAASASGQVIYVTETAAFVDAGSERGIALGQELVLERRKKEVGSCKVVQVSPERALCQSDRAAIGDRFTFNEAPQPAPAPPPKQMTPVPPPDVLESARRAVIATPVERVKHTPSAVSFSLRSQATLRQQVWWTSTTPQNSLFARPSLTGSVRAAFPFSPRLVAQGSVTITGDALAPTNQRFRPDDPVEIYVWGASVGTRDGFVVGEVGRFLARGVPGTLVLDGGQVGLRFLDGVVEVGTYGGLIPSLVTVMPGLERVTAGAYATFELRPLQALTVLPRVSAGMITDPAFATPRADVAAQLQTVLEGIGTLGGTVRGGMGTDGAAPTLDVANVDLEVNPLPAWRLAATWRLMGNNRFNFDAVDKAPVVQGSQHANASTSWELLPGWRLGAFGGMGINDTTGLVRFWAGPELHALNAFGRFGGFDLGYQEEPGDWPGRAGWVGSRIHFEPVWLQSRLIFSEQQAFNDNYREVGFVVYADAEILPGLSLTARFNGQQGLPVFVGAYRATPTLVAGDVGLRGSM